MEFSNSMDRKKNICWTAKHKINNLKVKVEKILSLNSRDKDEKTLKSKRHGLNRSNIDLRALKNGVIEIMVWH